MAPVPEGATLSDDGQWWWDGSQWQPVDDGGGDSAGDHPQAPSHEQGDLPVQKIEFQGVPYLNGTQLHWEAVNTGNVAIIMPGDNSDLVQLLEFNGADYLEASRQHVQGPANLMPGESYGNNCEIGPLTDGRYKITIMLWADWVVGHAQYVPVGTNDSGDLFFEVSDGVPTDPGQWQGAGSS